MAFFSLLLLFPIILQTCISLQFCDKILNDTCIRNTAFINKGNIDFATNLSILINNTKIICNNSESCSFVVSSQKNIQLQNSLIWAPYINISSLQNFSLNNSQISTNGTIGTNFGTSMNPNQGNSFLGLGAYCIKDTNFSNLAYGSFCSDSLYANKSLFGSGGLFPGSKGGGILNISTENLTLNYSFLSSSGFPLASVNDSSCQNSAAGSAGSIILHISKINLGENSSITAEGGYYCGMNGFGGPGGKVLINSNGMQTEQIMDLSPNITVTGGTNVNQSLIQNCRNGATGVLCVRDSGKNETSVLVDSKKKISLAPLFIDVDEINIFNKMKFIQNAFISLRSLNISSFPNELNISAMEFHSSTFTDSYIFMINFTQSISVGYKMENALILKENSALFLTLPTLLKGGELLASDSHIFFNNNTGFFLDKISIQNSEIAAMSEEISVIFYTFKFVFKNSTITSDYVSITSSNNFSLTGQIVSNKQNCTKEGDKDEDDKFFNFINYEQGLYINIISSYYIWSHNTSESVTSQNLVLFFLDLFKTNYTILLISEQDITLNPFFILNGSNIGIFAQNLDVLHNTTITSVSMGCAPFEGSAHGTKIFNAQYECGGNGGGYGGFQGYGLGADPVKSELCKQFALDFSFKYGDHSYPKYHGSGGGGSKGSYGGGIIYINVINTLFNDGLISSNGGDLSEEDCGSVKGSGAGSGGTVQVYTLYISGNGVISANGGDTYNYCGEGGGGRILMYLYNWESDSNTQSANAWKGKIEATKGNRFITLDALKNVSWSSFHGTNGTLFTSPCTSGFYSPTSSFLCQPCPSYTYKDTPGYEACLPCLNKPSKSEFLNLTGQKSMNCLYECDLNFGNFNQTSCFDYVATYFSLIDGIGVPIVIIITIFLLVIGRVTKNLLMKSSSIIKNYNYNNLDDFIHSSEKINGLMGQKKLKVEDLFFHVHRINIYGTNRYDNRWFLKSEPPEEIVYLVNIKLYRIFVQKFNKLLSWHWSTTFLMRTIAVIYYPLYGLLLDLLRRRKYSCLCKFLAKNEKYFWNKTGNQQNTDIAYIKMKFSADRELTLGYLNILCYKNPSKKYFKMQHPLTLMLSGEGSFFKPFYLDTNCPLFYTLYIALMKKIDKEIKLQTIKNKEKYIDSLKHFVMQINKVSCQIEFAANFENFLAPIWGLSCLIDYWNTNFWSKFFGFKLELILMQIPKEKYSNYENTITLLENKEYENFKHFIKEVHQIKTEYSLYDVKIGLFCLNLETESTNYYPTHRKISFMVDEEDSYFTKFSANNIDFEENEIVQYKETFKKKQESQSISHSSNLLILDKNIDVFEYIKKRNKRNLWKVARRILHIIRYRFISHKHIHVKKYILYIIVSIFVMLDAFCYCIFLINVFYLHIYGDFLTLFLFYPCAMLVSPVLGVFWISSCSYTVGKFYLIFNFMSCANLFLGLILTLTHDFEANLINLIIKICGLFFKLMICYFGSCFITHVMKKKN